MYAVEGQGGAMRVTWVWLIAVAVAVAAACGGGSASSRPDTYPPSWVGSDQAGRTGESGDEVSRTGLPRDTLVDDASLTYLDEQTACFDLAMRQTAGTDRALSDLGARCEAGETTSPIQLSSEAMVSVYDYDADGQLIEVVTEDVPSEAYDPGAADPPAAELQRVVERRSRVCCSVEPAGVLTLALPELELRWDLGEE